MTHRIQHSKSSFNDDKSQLELGNNNKEGSRQTSTDGLIRSIDPLDNAMKELLEMCKQFSDELSVDEEEDSSVHKSNSTPKEYDNGREESKNCDSNKLNHPNMMMMQMDKTSNQAPSQNCIKALQQKQTQLQVLLDEALETAKKLESKSLKRKCLLEQQIENQESTMVDTNQILDDDDEYDDELIEFQKIESELRISDLNRQLNVVQEELRMKLYRRLLFNTNVRKRVAPNIPKTKQNSKLITQNSCPDDSTPPSSSCSDEIDAPLVSTSNSYSDTSRTNLSHETNGSLKKETNFGVSNLDETQHRNEYVSSIITTPKDNDCNLDHVFSTEEREQLDTRLSTNNENDGQSHANGSTPMAQTASRDSGLSSSGRGSTSTDESTNIYSTPETSCSNQSTSTNTSIMYTSSPTCLAYHRNSSANSDLERIEEDEEDMQGFESSSPNHFRMIYEEKIAPIIHNNTAKADNQNSYYQPTNSDLGFISGNTSDFGCEGGLDSRLQYSSGIEEVFMKSDKRESLVSSAMATATTARQRQDNQQTAWSNRPLTLYLPRPNEKIDLVEHIQALGHDLNVITSDITINSTSASGYLRKQSSKNNRRWLKKYFHFDRASKTLCYYENEASLIKKKTLPKNCIPFANIYDVYVDHIRSGIGKKDLKSSKHYYIFVLSTADRKYSLASHRTETMRAWIDILFTAAQVNEYFE